MKINYSAYTEMMLLEALQHGEPGAFSQIYKQYYDPLYITAFRTLQFTEGADDVVQEVFVALWQYRQNLNIVNLGAYLNLSLRRAVQKAYNLKTRERAVVQHINHATRFIMQQSGLNADKEVQGMIQELIDALPTEEHKIIYRMSRHEDMSYPEIAARLGISVKTVEKKMSSSLKVIRLRLTQFFIWLLIALFFFLS